MQTKYIVLAVIIVALIILTGIMVSSYALLQPQRKPTTNTLSENTTLPESTTLPEKQTGKESMNLKMLTVAALATGMVIAAEAEEKITLKIDLPKPCFTGTPKDIRSPNLESDSVGKSREVIQVPTGTRLLSKGCKVTSSDPEPIIGELAFVTDGEKEHDAGTYVELGPNTQWVQLDLGKEKLLFAGCIWHYHGESRVYRDVICLVSNDPDFIEGVHTVFNNDHDNSSKLGVGTDKEYKEDNKGRPFVISGIKGRYIRFYSRGNTSNEMNHYTEVEVYGKDL